MIQKDLIGLLCVGGVFLQFTCVYVVFGYLFLLETD